MPRLDLTREAAALGVGVIDQFLERMDIDNKASPEPFQNFTDWARAGATVGSGLAYINGMMPGLAEPIMYASSSLLAKSTVRLIQEIMTRDSGGGGTVPARVRASQRALPSGRTAPNLNIRDSEFARVRTS